MSQDPTHLRTGTNLALAALALIATGCAGGSSGGGASDDDDAAGRTEIRATVVAPPQNSLTTAEAIVVRGATDVGADVTVASVRVGGVVATTTDDYATWTASVPLEPGRNELEVEVLDAAGVRHASGSRVAIERRAMLLETPRALVAAPDAIYFQDGGPAHGGLLLRVDRTSGERVSFATDTGFDPDVLAYDTTRDRFYAAMADASTVDAAEDGDETTTRIVGIDRFSGGQVEVGVITGAVRGLGFDGVQDRVLVVADGIVALDPTDGTMSRLIDDERDGVTVLGLTFDAAVNQILATVERGADGEDGPAIIAVDPRTAYITLLASDELGLGPSLAGLAPPLAYDGLTRRVYYAAGGELFVLDLFTRVRTRVPAEVGRHFAFDRTTRRLLASDGDALIELDLQGSEPRVVTRESFGGGPRLRAIAAGGFDSEAERIVVLDHARPGLVSVDPATGDRRPLSDAKTGNGPAWRAPRGLALDVAGRRAFVADSERGALVAVHLDTGDRSVVAGAQRGDGPELAAPRALADHARSDEVLFLADDLLAIDLVSGDRRVVATLGLESPAAIALDRDRVLLVDRDTGFVRSIDLESGAVERFEVTIEVEDLAGDPVEAAPAADELRSPRGLAVDVDARRAWVIDRADGGATATYELELDTGLWRPVAGLAPADEDATLLGMGPSPRDPRALVLDPRSGTLLVTCAHWHAVLHVDPGSGDRSIVSR